MKITAEQIAEAFIRTGMQVQYLEPPSGHPCTAGSVSLDKIADAVNTIPGISMIETMEMVGIKGGKEVPLGEVPLSASLKAREICREYGEDPDDENSLIMGALEALINWQNTQRIANEL